MTESSFPTVNGVYAHVPFCVRKCAYCAFYSEPSPPDLIDRFVAALVREMESAAPLGTVGSVFFGGGTPSILRAHHWERVFTAMDRLGLKGVPEFSIECNPASVTPETATLWRDFGVNRLSLGVQSFDEDILRLLGRIHSPRQARDSFDALRKCGFDNINLDLMFAIPGQSMEAWRHTVRQALEMQPEHLACYEVIYEEDTPFFERLRAGQYREDEDLSCAMYELLLEETRSAGLVQYEVANFARDRRPSGPMMPAARYPRCPEGSLPGLACLHNVNYWRGGPYYGFGPSAAWHLNGVRGQNWSDTRRYCASIEARERPVESTESLPPLARAGETAAFGLRMNIGWPFEQFRQITGFDLRSEWAEDIRFLCEQELAVADEVGFRLTSRGMRFADAAAQRFLRTGSEP